jgi:hypothetical protein
MQLGFFIPAPPCEAAMTNTTRPAKETVREYFQRRTLAPLEPPPTPEEIRQQLGWHLIPANRRPDRGDPD